MPVHSLSTNIEQFNSNLASEKGISMCILHIVSVLKQLREAHLGYPPGVLSGPQSSHGGCDHSKILLSLENVL